VRSKLRGIKNSRDATLRFGVGGEGVSINGERKSRKPKAKKAECEARPQSFQEWSKGKQGAAQKGRWKRGDTKCHSGALLGKWKRRRFFQGSLNCGKGNEAVE